MQVAESSHSTVLGELCSLPCHSHWGLNVSLNELHFNLFLLSTWPGPNWMPGTPLKVMHNSSAGRPRRPFIMGQGSRRERRQRGEGEKGEKRRGRSWKGRKNRQVGGEGRKGTWHSCSHSAFQPLPQGHLLQEVFICKPQALLSLVAHCTGQTSVTLDYRKVALMFI